MNALFLRQRVSRKVMNKISMFANQGSTVLLSGSHGYVSARKRAVHFEVCGLEGPANWIASKGNGANKNARFLFYDLAPKGVKTLRKRFYCAHLITF